MCYELTHEERRKGIISDETNNGKRNSVPGVGGYAGGGLERGRRWGRGERENRVSKLDVVILKADGKPLCQGGGD